MKTKLKRILSLVMMTIFVFSLFPHIYTEAATSDGQLYYRIENGQAVVTGCSSNAESITIPEYYYGYPVTKIADSAFKGHTWLGSVTIGKNVKSIGNNAFSKCALLTDITISGSETSIGDYAFYECSGLTSITIPDGVTSIGEYAFARCYNLTDVTMFDSVTSLGSYAFSDCYKLENILFSDNIKIIRKGTFYKCVKLGQIWLPNNLESIESEAFPFSNIGSVYIPGGIKNIDKNAFKDCDSVGVLYFLEGTKRITCYLSYTIDIGRVYLPESLIKTDYPIPHPVYVSGSFLDDTQYTGKNVMSKTPDPPTITDYYYNKQTGGLTIYVDNEKFYSRKRGNIYKFRLYSRTELPNPNGTNKRDTNIFKTKIDSKGQCIFYQEVSSYVIEDEFYYTALYEKYVYRDSLPSKPVIFEVAKDPIVSSVTETSITLNPTAGFEYRMDNGKWQDSNVFENLPLNSTHTFEQRKKSSENFIGLESSSVSVSTAKHVHTAVGGWQTDASGHYKLCSCGQKFDSGKHSGGEATCSSPAVCEICGTSYGEKNLTNHKNTEIRGKVAATCSKEGYSGDMYCLDCGEKISSGKTLDKLKHSYKDEVVPPTFGKQGYTLHTCTLCGDTYKDNYTSYVPSETDPVIKVSSVRGILGNQVKVAVSLKNNPGIVSMALQLNYDENVLKLINVEDCGVLGTQVHNPTLGTPYYLNWVNDTATANFTANGDIVILTFEVLENAALGKTAVTVSYTPDNYEIYDKDGTEVNFAVESGYVDVSDILIGDVNGDGVVNGKDRLLLTRWLANWPEALAEGINEAAADVNCDGKVNGLDRLILTRHLARWEEYATLPYTK